ncbi:helix-turn-helix domain-containing protein [Myxococcota bacterium]|nr:helix-turn-helix domain-containing protein [Myxococcota bacterium]
MGVDGAENRVRARREACGLSQVALAELAELTRQSIGAIEAGRAVPSVDVALRIAKALGATVEELFGGDEERVVVTCEPGAPRLTGRVALTRVRGRWIAHPLAEDVGVRVSADGLVTGGRARVDVELLGRLTDAEDNVVVMGCAGALGLVADRLNAKGGAGRFVWLPRSSTSALEALARGHVHVAGMHLVDGRTGEANVADLKKLEWAEPIVLVTLARWEAGLLVRADDHARVRSVADLARRGVRLAAREPGAGARRLLERELRAAKLPLDLAREARLTVTGHLDVARAIAIGAADAGIATRDAALAFGLDFVPLAEERYDLALPKAALDDARVTRLLDAVTSLAVRRELSALGYDCDAAGQRVAEIAAS